MFVPKQNRKENLHHLFGIFFFFFLIMFGYNYKKIGISHYGGFFVYSNAIIVGEVWACLKSLTMKHHLRL